MKENIGGATLKKGRLVILGGGESGVGAATLGKKKGWEVFVSDSGKIKDKYKKELKNINVKWEEGHHSESEILKAKEIIKSPGIPDTVPLILRARAAGIPVISEIEFAGRYTAAKFIGITGSNGKTTTTLLTYHMLKKAGLNVGVAGNVGDSLAKQVAEDEKDYYVLELSSFQLDGMFNFRVHIAMILNITPDHLDRYEDKFENYVLSKFRILQNQQKEDCLIYNEDDPTIVNQLKKKRKYKGVKYPFSIKKKLSIGASINKKEIIIKTNNKLFNMTIQQLALQGKHNLYNSMASAMAGKILELKKDVIRESLSDFQNVEHRLEEVGKVHGITFINDSKATNINAAWYALESFDRPVIWIVGGIDKGNDYEMLKDLVSDKVKAIVCLGKDNQKVHEAFDDVVEDIVDANSAEEAVNTAYKLGTKGDTVLLSPACASFDLFENYEDRGHQFKTAVKGL